MMSASSVPTINLRELDLDRRLGQVLSKEISLKIEGVCIGRPDDQHLTIVVTHPEETYIYDLVELFTEHRWKAQLFAGDPETIKLAIEYIYDVPAARLDESWKSWLESKKFSTESLDLVSKGESGQVAVTGDAVEAADRLIKEAIASGASDIHLETYADGVLVRYRRDGVLQTVNNYNDLPLARALVKRLKVMANMDLTQERSCQGGRISVQVGGQGFDLRVSAVPVADGESLVMRLLSKRDFSTTLPDLGMSGDSLARYRSMIECPFGMILACGPTGSGKSTTLYASLKSIARPDRKLLTIEDPVEYQMPGIVQVQVNVAPKNEERRVTFSAALKEFLRQDPDVILVGEIRDQETAKVSVQAGLTGHLVLSTIHTNDAIGVVNRLKDMGVPPYLIASTLIGSVAQRLVRKLCPNCAVPSAPDAEALGLLSRFGLETSNVLAAHPNGCQDCRGLGYRGRVGLYEVLCVTDELKQEIEKGATALEMKKIAVSQGMKTLLEDGLSKVISGQTSVAEVKRVCQDALVG